MDKVLGVTLLILFMVAVAIYARKTVTELQKKQQRQRLEAEKKELERQDIEYDMGPSDKEIGWLVECAIEECKSCTLFHSDEDFIRAHLRTMLFNNHNDWLNRIDRHSFSIFYQDSNL